MDPKKYGSLEELERSKSGGGGLRSTVAATAATRSAPTPTQNDDGVALEDLMEDISYEMDSSRAGTQNRDVLAEFDRKRAARSLAIPTNDAEVRARLRQMGEPITLFGEEPIDRRDRLRYLVSTTGVSMQVDQESDSEEEEDEFYTPGSEALLEARRWITHYSMPRAKARLLRERKEHDLPLATHINFRKELYTHLKEYTILGSQIGDERPVAQVRFSPDSKMVATGGWGGLAKLWSVPDAEPIRNLRGHTAKVGGIAWHPLATVSLDKAAANLATGGGDGKVLLWNLEQDEPLATLEGHTNRVCRVAFHPSGRFLASASFDGTWRFWDVESQTELLLQEGHSKEVYAVACQDDGTLVASGGLDSIGRVWDIRTGRTAMVLDGHSKDILAMEFAPNGHQVATGSADNTIRIWDIRKLTTAYTVPAHKNLVSDLRFFREHPSEFDKDQAMTNGHSQPMLSGLYLVSSSYDGEIKFWSGDDWQLEKTLVGHDGKVMSVDLSGDGQWVVSGGWDRTFKIWGAP